MSARSRLKKSSRILEKLVSLKSYRKARTVMFFVTHGSEVVADIMIERALKDGKRTVVPKADTGTCTLKAHAIKSLDRHLRPCAYGIREPKTLLCPEVPPRGIDLVFVPGIAFDLSGHRLGYGKGYYDRWLKKFGIKKRVGLCFDFQLKRRIPRTENDLPVGRIITEKRAVEIDSKGATWK